jgi:putative transposon-encoded protein
VITIQITKKGWKREREILPSFVCYAVAHGNAATMYPTLPREYIGKTLIVTVVEPDSDLAKELKKI